MPYVVSRRAAARGEAMGVFRLRRLWFLVCLLLCLGDLTSCAVLGGQRGGLSGPKKSPGQEAGETLFNDAERAYRQRDYTRARNLYRAFLTDYPRSPLIEDASFRLAEILYYEGTYAAASQTLQEYLTKFPRAKLAPDAAYLRGLSLLHLKRYAEAREVLEGAQRSYPNSLQQAAFMLALAKVSIAEGQYIRALDELHALTAARQIPEDMQQEARTQTINIIAEKLPSAELEPVKQRWPHEFPSDYILLRQAKQAWNRREAVQTEAAAQEFLIKFPDHPEAPQMRALLTNLEQARSVSVDRHKIGVILPLSSPQRREWVSEVGQSALQGIQVAFAREGFGPLKMEVRDSKANLSTTATVMEELATGQRVIAVVGPLFNETTQVAAKKALQFRLPLITPGAPSLEIPADNPYVIRTALTNRLEARRLAEYAVGNLGLRRFAILYPDDPPGRELAETFHLRVSDLGGDVIIRHAYAPNQVDFTAAVRQLGGQTDEELKLANTAVEGGTASESTTQMRASNGKLAYEALYLPRSFERLQFLVPAMRLLNITGITVLGESGWNHPELVKRAGVFVEGAVFMDSFFANASDSQVREFVQNYRAMFNATPDLMAAQSYDAMLMLLRVLKQQPQTREEVREKLRNLKDVRAATGWMGVLPDGDVDRRLFALTVRRGQIVQLN
jgi:ABC-type branched-subunit amino acid transport system substrate-binding protein/TolA-binding protein